MSGKMIIAVDGPSASGKGTIAKGLARYFGYAHLDTGLLYRAVGYMASQKNPSMDNKDIAIEIAKSFTADNIDNPLLRTDEASVLASKVAVIPQVREALLNYQRNFAIAPPADGAVLDGRDIGTVICPLAPVKLFITASIETRAKRRHSELERLLGRSIDFNIVIKDLQERDKRDMNRATAPLKQADDSVLLDTTHMSIDTAISQAIRLTELVLLQENRHFACI